MSKGLTQAQVSAMIAEAVAAALRAQAGATTPATKPARAKKTKAAASHFADLAGATPKHSGKGAKFTITLGDLTFACEKRNDKIFARTTNGAGDERWIVMKPSTPDALHAGQYLAVVARRYGLVK